jgi:hypothetical protein
MKGHAPKNDKFGDSSSKYEKELFQLRQEIEHLKKEASVVHTGEVFYNIQSCPSIPKADFEKILVDTEIQSILKDKRKKIWIAIRVAQENKFFKRLNDDDLIYLGCVMKRLDFPIENCDCNFTLTYNEHGGSGSWVFSINKTKFLEEYCKFKKQYWTDFVMFPFRIVNDPKLNEHEKENFINFMKQCNVFNPKEMVKNCKNPSTLYQRLKDERIEPTIINKLIRTDLEPVGRLLEDE